MPEKVTPEEVEKRDLQSEIERLQLELSISKSREKNLASLVEKTNANDPALMLHYEGIILRQRATLAQYSHVMWKRKELIRSLRERVAKAERRNRKRAEVVVPMDDSAEHPQAKTA